MFREGLNPTLQTELATKDESLSLSEYITLTIKIDNLMRNRPRSSAPRPVPVTISSPVSLSADSDEPMQIGRARVPEEERQRRRDEGLCFYCGQPGHLCNACPDKAKHPAGSSKRVSITFDTVSGQNFTLPVTILTEDNQSYVTALVDSGAALNLIHHQTITKFNIPTLPCNPPIRITAVDNAPIGTGQITQKTIPIQIQVGLFHVETITLCHHISLPPHYTRLPLAVTP